MVAPSADGVGYLIGACDNHAARSARDVFATAKAEDADVADGSKMAAVRFHTHRLGRIFHDHDATRLAESSNASDVRCDPEQVVSHHTQRVTAERLLEKRVIEIERRGIDVTERGSEPGLQNGRRHREASVGGDDDLSPVRRRLQGHQRQRQRGSARRHEKDMADAEVLADLVFERANRALGRKDPLDAVAQILPTQRRCSRRHNVTDLHIAEEGGFDVSRHRTCRSRSGPPSPPVARRSGRGLRSRRCGSPTSDSWR